MSQSDAVREILRRSNEAPSIQGAIERENAFAKDFPGIAEPPASIYRTPRGFPTHEDLARMRRE